MIHTKLENMNLLDKFLFDEAMEDRKIYEVVVSILLENEVELLGKTETEKEFRVSPELRQVRLDVVGMDREKTVYYTEMQKRNTGNLAKRSRYYQAQMDVSLLEPGSTDLKLGDGAVRIFINTQGTNEGDFSQEFLDFMEYIERTTDETAGHSGSERIKEIHKTVKQIRKSEEVGVRYMQRWEELVYARKDGKAEVNRLGVLLKEAGRVDDFLESLSDEELQKKLFIEFGLKEA